MEKLDELVQDYNSTVASYKVVRNHSLTEGGAALMINGRTGIQVSVRTFRSNPATDELKLGKNQIYGTTYHEFAHSLSQSREKTNPEFWKEIRKIRKEYNVKRGGGDWFDKKISYYADHDIDEFFAEAFTQAKLSETPSEYSKQVLAVTDKYFKKSIAKGVDSGIIKSKEMFRKNSDVRNGFKFISNKTFDDLTISARKKGAIILRGTKEIETHLDRMGAAASNLGDILMFRKDVCISEVLEETYHFEQNLRKMNADKDEPIKSILNEIDAKRYILDNEEKYKIPRKEIELTKRQLESYEKQLKQYEE